MPAFHTFPGPNHSVVESRARGNRRQNRTLTEAQGFTLAPSWGLCLLVEVAGVFGRLLLLSWIAGQRGQNGVMSSYNRLTTPWEATASGNTCWSDRWRRP